jgi:TetR/AcrR family transcriptional regulator, cholesterol catabolism regulator
MSRLTDRQSDVLDGARQLFSARGFAATSMRDLAESVGVLPGSLYAHFRSKTEILGAIVESFYDEVVPIQESAMEAGHTGFEKLDLMLDGILPVIARRRHDFLVVSAEWSTIATDDSIRAAAAKTQRSYDLWAGAIDAGQRDGSIRADTDCDILVAATTFALVGVVHTTIGFDPAPSNEVAMTVITSARRIITAMAACPTV